MTEFVTSLYASYGLAGMALTLAVAQFGLPLPTSIVLMSVGALLGAADFSVFEAYTWALGGAVAGDQAGYLVGRVLGSGLEKTAGKSSYVAAGLAKTREFTDRWGRASVFLSRWLVSPAGPWVNLTSGASRMPWPAFSIWDISGEAIWVAKYIAIGFAFSAYIPGIAEVFANAGWALAALAVAGFTGWHLWRRATNASPPNEPTAQQAD